MGHRIASFTAILIVVAVVAFRPAWPSRPEPVRAQTGFVDLVITKSDDPDPVASGDPLTYTVVVRNDGDMPAGSPSTPVNVIDFSPLQFTLGSFSIAPTGSCVSVPPQEVRCQVDTLGPGDSVTITIDGYVTLPFGGQVKNIAFVDLPVSQIPETVETLNNIDSENTTILGFTTATATQTATPTFTATLTPTPSSTATQTSTPTQTPKPVGGVSNDIAGRSPQAASNDSPFPDDVPIAGVIGVVVGMVAASACLRYVKHRARA